MVTSTTLTIKDHETRKREHPRFHRVYRKDRDVAPEPAVVEEENASTSPTLSPGVGVILTLWRVGIPASGGADERAA